MNETIDILELILETADYFKSSYFWSSPQSAKQRRYYEELHSVPLHYFEFGGHSYTVEYTVRCSCKNIYARGFYTRDGKKTTLTTIKNVLKKMKQL